MKKTSLIGLTFVAAIPSAALAYFAIRGVMALSLQSKMFSLLGIICMLTATVGVLAAVWPPLYAFVWYGSPAKADDATDAESEEGAAEEVSDAGPATDDDIPASGEEEPDGFAEEDIDSVQEEMAADDDDTKFHVDDDDVSQAETSDFQMDADDEFGDLDFDDEEEEEAPKAKKKKK